MNAVAVVVPEFGNCQVKELAVAHQSTSKRLVCAQNDVELLSSLERI